MAFEQEPDKDPADELEIRLTYLEATVIALYVMLKERSVRDEEGAERFSADFHDCFCSAMEFLTADPEDGERPPHWTAMDEAHQMLDSLVHSVEHGKRPPQAPSG